MTPTFVMERSKATWQSTPTPVIARSKATWQSPSRGLLQLEYKIRNDEGMYNQKIHREGGHLFYVETEGVEPSSGVI